MVVIMFTCRSEDSKKIEELYRADLYYTPTKHIKIEVLSAFLSNWIPLRQKTSRQNLLRIFEIICKIRAQNVILKKWNTLGFFHSMKTCAKTAGLFAYKTITKRTLKQHKKL